MNEFINTDVKVQTIYYLDNSEELGKYYVSSPTRITIDRANDILTEKDISFSEVLKTQTQRIPVSIPLELFESYIITE